MVYWLRSILIANFGIVLVEGFLKNPQILYKYHGLGVYTLSICTREYNILESELGEASLFDFISRHHASGKCDGKLCDLSWESDRRLIDFWHTREHLRYYLDKLATLRALNRMI